MCDVEVLQGRLSWSDTPEWSPLEATLPDLLCGRFMWMHRVLLDGDREVEAYKHADTRRYLLLEEGAVAYEDLGRGRYRVARLHDALEQAFGVWWVLRHATAEEREALRSALDSASLADQAAGRGTLPPSSPASPFRWVA
jgi:hypothetical protein